MVEEEFIDIAFPVSGGQGIRLKGINSEIIKISKCNDDDEFIITGKQLKQLQGFWRKNEKPT